MSDPWSAKSSRRSNEMQDDLDNVVMRLRRMGATEDEVDALRSGWDSFDEDWTPERRAAFIAAPDSSIVEDLRAVREEWAAMDPGTLTGVASPTLDEVMGGTIPVVLAWVGDDPARAAAALAFEAGPNGSARIRLIQRLDGIVDGPAG